MGLLVSMMNGSSVGLDVGLDVGLVVGLNVGLGVGLDVGLGILMGVGYPIIGSKGVRMEGAVSAISTGFALGIDVGLGMSLGGSTIVAESKRQADAWPTSVEIAIRVNERFMALSKLVFDSVGKDGEMPQMTDLEAKNKLAPMTL